MSLIQLNDNKAGMGGLNKEKINAIIIENSRGSKFYENEVKKEKVLEKQIEQKLKHLKSLTPNDIRKGEMETDKIITQIIENRNYDKFIVHVDMDAFYAAVEVRENPKLRHIPMAVGSDKMLSTSNYIARRFGVRAAMPGFIAKKLCPELEIVDLDFAKYTKASAEIRQIFSLYDSNFAAVSLDEAYLDLTEHMNNRETSTEEERTFTSTHICKCRKRSCTNNTDPELAVCDNCGQLWENGARTFSQSLTDAIREIRFRIFAQSRLTASAGAGPNTLIAKIASDQKKPNGQFIVNGNPDSVALFIRELLIRKIPGIGKVSERKLQSYGVSTCFDLYIMRGSLYHLCSSAALNYYMRIALGVGDTSLENDSERKSRSVERTFNDINDESILVAKCHELSAMLSADLKEEHIKGKTLTIKMKLSTFETRTRAQTMELVTNDFPRIFACSKELLTNEIRAETPKKLTLRLLGLRMSSLVDEEMCTTVKQWTIQEAFASAKLLSNSAKNTPTKDSSKPLSGEIKELTAEDPSLLESNDSNLDDGSLMLSNDFSTVIGASSSPVYPSTSAEAFRESRSCSPQAQIISRSCSPSSVVTEEDTKDETNFLLSGNSFQCPVCEKFISGVDANIHLDLCLSKSAIQEAIKDATNITPKRPAASVARSSSMKRSKSQSSSKMTKQSPGGPMDKYLKFS